MKAELLIGATNAEMRHRTGIVAPDSFFYLKEEGGNEMVFFDAREFDVQKKNIAKTGRAITVERLEPYFELGLKNDGSLSTAEKTLLAILAKKDISSIVISQDIPYKWATVLKENNLTIEAHDFSLERLKKTKEEINAMKKVQKMTDEAFAFVKRILEESLIKDDVLEWCGEVLTSERLKFEIETNLLRCGLWCPDGIIVASKEQTARPHDEGSGPIHPHELIIVDIFPQDRESGYFADMTRTFSKGNPPVDKVLLYEAVQKAQEAVIAMVKPGVSCKELHNKAVAIFAECGYETTPQKGFMHGTGHGLGLAVHEGPSLNRISSDVIEPGMVVTIEPGLYYPNIGGVRIEDVVVVHPDGVVENITEFEKVLIVK